MTLITGYTALRCKSIEDNSIVDGDVVGNDLILTKYNGSTINAGNVRGPQGPTGNPPLVSTLPGSPSDGEEIYFQNSTMATLGLVWHLKYRSGASGSYKWEFVGGSGLMSATNGSVALSTIGANTALSSDISVVVPLAGDYYFESMATASHSGNNQGIYWFPTGAGMIGSGTSEGVSYAGQPGTANNTALPMAGNGRLTALIAGGTLTMGYFVGASGGSLIAHRAMKITPIRVG